VEAWIVAAPGAVTAFAVPNPNCTSQSSRFFRVWLRGELPRQADRPAYFGPAKKLLPTLSAVDSVEGASWVPSGDSR
jgi:hypothetical protein